MTRDLVVNLGVAVLIAISTLLTTCHGRVRAQDAVAIPELALPEVGETVALDAGTRAPWAGMLVRDEDLFGLQSALMTSQMRIANAERLHVEVLAGRQALLDAALAGCEERVRLRDELWSSRRDELLRALEQSRAREGAEWFENPVLWLAVGVIAGGAVVGLIASVL